MTVEIVDAISSLSEINWFTAYLIPRCLFLIILALFSWRFGQMTQKKHVLKGLVFLLLIGFGSATYLLINTPYKADWNSKGTLVKNVKATEPILTFIDSTNTNFDGIACMALTDCDYCHDMIDELIKMKVRKPSLDVVIFLFALDSIEIQTFEKQIGNIDIPVFSAPAPNISFLLTYGNFPTLLYIKNSSVKQRWYNNQFGYPVRDLIESGAF